MSCYKTLGIKANADEREIKRAYAKLIKQFRPDSHPADFARIREAYEIALRELKWREVQIVETDDDYEVVKSTQQSQSQISRPHNDIDLEPKLDEIDPIAAITFAYKNGDELAAIKAYEAIEKQYGNKTLDDKMLLEDSLLSHFLYGEYQSLLVFSAAEQEYGWLGNQLHISQHYGDWAGRKLEVFYKLWHFYHQAAKVKNSAFGFQSEVNDVRAFVKEVGNQKNTKAQVAEWLNICQSWGFEHLENYVKKPESVKFKLKWFDLYIVLALAVLIVFKFGDANMANDAPLFICATIIASTAVLIVQYVVFYSITEIAYPKQFGSGFRLHLSANYGRYIWASFVTRGVVLGIILLLLILNYLTIFLIWISHYWHAIQLTLIQQYATNGHKRSSLKTGIFLLNVLFQSPVILAADFFKGLRLGLLLKSKYFWIFTLIVLMYFLMPNIIGFVDKSSGFTSY